MEPVWNYNLANGSESQMHFSCICLYACTDVVACMPESVCVCVCISHVWKCAVFSNLVQYERMLQVHLLFLALRCRWLHLPQRLRPYSALIGWFCGGRSAAILWVHILRRDLMQSGLLAGLSHQLHIRIHTHISVNKMHKQIRKCLSHSPLLPGQGTLIWKKYDQ